MSPARAIGQINMAQTPFPKVETVAELVAFQATATPRRNCFGVHKARLELQGTGREGKCACGYAAEFGRRP